MWVTVERSPEEFKELENENARLRKVVEKVPVDANGRHVFPGDLVWHPLSAWPTPLIVQAGSDGLCGPDGWSVHVPTEVVDGEVVDSINGVISECVLVETSKLDAPSKQLSAKRPASDYDNPGLSADISDVSARQDKS